MLGGAYNNKDLDLGFRVWGVSTLGVTLMELPIQAGNGKANGNDCIWGVVEKANGNDYTVWGLGVLGGGFFCVGMAKAFWGGLQGLY